MNAPRAKEAIERAYGDPIQAGKRLGVSKQHVYKYMSGSSAIGGAPLEKLCFDSSSTPAHLYGRTREEVIDYLARTIERETGIAAGFVVVLAHMNEEQRSKLFVRGDDLLPPQLAAPREPFEDDQQRPVSEPSGAGTPKKRSKRGASRRKPG